MLPSHVAPSWYSLFSEDVVRVTRVLVQSVVPFTKQELKTFLDPAVPQVALPPRENGNGPGDISLFVIRKVVTGAVPINRWRFVARVDA